MSLKIDKENEYVSYNDEAHKYWTKKGKLPCISVTTLIHSFTTFDEKFWSEYKAVQKVIGDVEFDAIKKQLQKDKKINIERLGIDKDEFEKAKNERLKEWEDKRNTSCERGTIIHREHELGHLTNETPELKKLGLGGKFDFKTTNKIELKGQHVYPEILLSYTDGDIWIAGQADLIITSENNLYLLDYKTNKKIDKKGFFDSSKRTTQKMKFPLSSLEDCNFNHYQMQLSTYAYMVECTHPDVNIETLQLIHYDHEGKCTYYECEYLKSLVIKMIKEYKRKLEYERFKKSDEPIVY
jgi:ATP-dependent exoDNAse (exonuclease V) beta subunit